MANQFIRSLIQRFHLLSLDSSQKIRRKTVQFKLETMILLVPATLDTKLIVQNDHPQPSPLLEVHFNGQVEVPPHSTPKRKRRLATNTLRLGKGVMQSEDHLVHQLLHVELIFEGVHIHRTHVLADVLGILDRGVLHDSVSVPELQFDTDRPGSALEMLQLSLIVHGSEVFEQKSLFDQSNLLVTFPTPLAGLLWA